MLSIMKACAVWCFSKPVCWRISFTFPFPQHACPCVLGSHFPDSKPADSSPHSTSSSHVHSQRGLGQYGGSCAFSSCPTSLRGTLLRSLSCRSDLLERALTVAERSCKAYGPKYWILKFKLKHQISRLCLWLSSSFLFLSLEHSSGSETGRCKPSTSLCLPLQLLQGLQILAIGVPCVPKVHLHEQEEATRGTTKQVNMHKAKAVNDCSTGSHRPTRCPQRAH